MRLLQYPHFITVWLKRETITRFLQRREVRGKLLRRPRPDPHQRQVQERRPPHRVELTRLSQLHPDL
jgi:hypothetical protein